MMSIDCRWRRAFQSTPLREGRRTNILLKLTSGVFQSTPLREGRLSSYLTFALLRRFNPRPYVRGDIDILGQTIQIIVSIHAPT